MSDLSKLISIVKQLRAPDGCDWDKEQTKESLIPYFIEEMYEVIEAIEGNDTSALKEELGDLLLHIVFQAEILSENQNYQIKDSIKNVCEKLIARHPHIFNNSNDKSYEIGNWEKTKKKEKNRDSVLDGVPKAMPALLRARRIQEKAAGVGFDWKEKKQVLDKIDEEIAELKEAIISNKGIDEELGDVLFTVVNLSRHLELDPESSLKSSINKFSKRFKKIEKELDQKDIDMKNLTLEELDNIWEKNKKN